MVRKQLLAALIVILFVATIPLEALAVDYTIVFDNIPPSIVNFGSPLSTYAGVNSKWNQPRGSGTNPHNGVDLQAGVNTETKAPYAGWQSGVKVAGDYDILFLVDANNNRAKDDGDYYIRFYHMNAREPDGYRSKGDKIGASGDKGGVPAHLHFGICSETGGIKWLRNEPNYRYLASTSWNSGKDLDAYALVEWKNGNTVSISSYIMNDRVKEYFSEIRMYYRTTTGGLWTDGGVITRSGDNYSYNFSGKISSGTAVQYMMRITRSGISQVAFCPAKFYQPASNPNSSSYAYGYWTNTVS
jgi:murein DD-endopeptidase MepM/ murein hydrolase activator NlpD